ncbi:MAG: hypothetical protein Q4B06_04185 [Candidatus Saccharibacteria bacterium]|nr:hypothetical protein [Candidatus Saccharibacteria bacterium]
MRYKKYLITLSVAVLSLVLPAAVVQPAFAQQGGGSGGGAKQQVLGGLQSVDNNNTTADTLPEGIKSVINMMLFIAGAVAVIMIIIGGIRFVTSNGDASSVTAARHTILYAVIGLIVIILAYAIVNFVVSNIG